MDPEPTGHSTGAADGPAARGLGRSVKRGFGGKRWALSMLKTSPLSPHFSSPCPPAMAPEETAVTAAAVVVPKWPQVLRRPCVCQPRAEPSLRAEGACALWVGDVAQASPPGHWGWCRARGHSSEEAAPPPCEPADRRFWKFELEPNFQCRPQIQLRNDSVETIWSEMNVDIAL